MTSAGFIEEIEDIVIPEVYNVVDYLALGAWKDMRGIQELEKN